MIISQVENETLVQFNQQWAKFLAAGEISNSNNGATHATNFNQTDDFSTRNQSSNDDGLLGREKRVSGFHASSNDCFESEKLPLSHLSLLRNASMPSLTSSSSLSSIPPSVQKAPQSSNLNFSPPTSSLKIVSPVSDFTKVPAPSVLQETPTRQTINTTFHHHLDGSFASNTMVTSLDTGPIKDWFPLETLGKYVPVKCTTDMFDEDYDFDSKEGPAPLMSPFSSIVDGLPSEVPADTSAIPEYRCHHHVADPEQWTSPLSEDLPYFEDSDEVSITISELKSELEDLFEASVTSSIELQEVEAFYYK